MNSKKIYKVDSFGCVFSSREKFAQQLEDIINKHAADGWRFCHLTTPGAIGEMCAVIFEKDADDQNIENIKE